MTDAPHHRPRRLQVPTLVAGLAVGALLAGAVVPLTGDDVSSTTGATVPGFLQDVTPGDPGSGAGSDGAATTTPTSSVDGGAPGSTTTTRPGSGPADGPRTASDVGVTPDVIKVGGQIIQCAACKSLGTEVPSNIPDIAQAFVDDINARGGINGRRVQLVVRQFDAVGDALAGTNTERAACVDLTEKEKVFAALPLGTANPECLYDEHKTPIINAVSLGDLDPETFNASEGRLWLLPASTRRRMVNLGDQLVATGLVKPGEKYGIVASGNRGIDKPVRQWLVPQLQARGVPPSQVAYLPADAAAQPAAIASEGARMRQAGISKVLLVPELVAAQLWVQEAERNSWKPQYLTGDLGTANQEVGAKTLGKSFAGAIAVSSTLPDGTVNPARTRCFDLWTKKAGRPMTTVEEPYVLGFCDSFKLLEEGMRRAGVDLTRRTFAQGMARIGQVTLAAVPGSVGSVGGAYAFGPVKWSASDTWIVKRWDGQRYVLTADAKRMSA